MMVGFRKTSFKTCPQLHRNMRITDPRWPAARELSRIILRTEGITIRGPSWMKEQVHNLSIRLGDVQPARTMFPAFSSHERDEILVATTSPPQTLAICGAIEPSIDILWLPMNPSEAWQTIASMTDDLLNAGYPGCLGCGGPQSEQPWNENQSRKSINEDTETAP